MNLEKYTDRARGFVQSAQSLALREGHQQFAPDHLLKVLLDDPEGLAAGLIDRSGGNSREALRAVEAGACQAPEGRGRREPGSFTSIRRSRACSTLRKNPARRRAIRSSPSSGCCSA
jgi:ATP-dependent Clp protease ATP-binding subunit ClpA